MGSSRAGSNPARDDYFSCHNAFTFLFLAKQNCFWQISLTKINRKSIFKIANYKNKKIKLQQHKQIFLKGETVVIFRNPKYLARISLREAKIKRRFHNIFLI